MTQTEILIAHATIFTLWASAVLTYPLWGLALTRWELRRLRAKTAKRTAEAARRVRPIGYGIVEEGE